MSVTTVRHRRLLSLAAGAAVLSMGAAGATSAAAAGAPNTAPLVIGVDHADPANQNPATGRVFEYTDFFTRDYSVHSGQVLNLQNAPGSFHIIGLSRNEQKARVVYPLGFADRGQQKSTGGPIVALGPSFFSVTGGSLQGGGTVGTNPNGPPPCGVPAVGEPNCTFTGGEDVEISGPNPGFGPTGPAPADWLVQINAPVGTYHAFCYIHPGMTSTLHVVPANVPATRQADVDASSRTQFQELRRAGLSTMAQLNNVTWTGGAPGHRTYLYYVGASASDNHVAINAMLPNRQQFPVHLVRGDDVHFVWPDGHNIHSVTFPVENPISPFGFDCGTSFQSPGSGPPCTEPGEAPEFVIDPGNARSGTALTTPTTLVDSGPAVGTDYPLVGPSSDPNWTVRTNAGTGSGIYTFHCTIHDFMSGSLSIS